MNYFCLIKNIPVCKYWGPWRMHWWWAPWFPSLSCTRLQRYRTCSSCWALGTFPPSWWESAIRRPGSSGCTCSAPSRSGPWRRSTRAKQISRKKYVFYWWGKKLTPSWRMSKVLLAAVPATYSWRTVLISRSSMRASSRSSCVKAHAPAAISATKIISSTQKNYKVKENRL